ncbi:MAG: hypothetical protein DHS20C17_03850 [Cyclobacteriaceae bacterium]|nr:MAG: hypothetical protein DHS20C17_03850 [Cyclobacteriaceae bacterium]
MISKEQAVIRHKYRNQLLATPPSKQIKVLMIGNNPREMGCLSLHLRNFRWKRFVVNATFDLKEGWRIAQYYKPDYVLIEGSFEVDDIKEFINQLRSNKSTKLAIVTLLKENNHTELMIPGVQDYLLKDNIASDTFAFDILNAIAHKVQTEEHSVVNIAQPESSWFPGMVFRKRALLNH